MTPSVIFREHNATDCWPEFVTVMGRSIWGGRVVVLFLGGFLRLLGNSLCIGSVLEMMQ